MCLYASQTINSFCHGSDPDDREAGPEPESGDLWSISPTIYEQLFHTKVFGAAFLYLHYRFKLFRRKEIGAKAARKMLVKLTPDVRSCLDKTNQTSMSSLSEGVVGEMSLK